MVVSQIDPARLEGAALRRWYVRSPAEIEEERRQAASRTYDAFFSRRDDNQPAGPDPTLETRVASSPNNTAVQWTRSAISVGAPNT